MDHPKSKKRNKKQRKTSSALSLVSVEDKLEQEDLKQTTEEKDSLVDEHLKDQEQNVDETYNDESEKEERVCININLSVCVSTNTQLHI
jgi:hypothetical protein